jgi:hypothetical protein
MPVATLTFSLPDESGDHRAALAGVDALIALERIDNRMRAIVKYGEPSKEIGQLCEEVRAMIPESLRGILE